jgi:transposase-like protein
MARTCTVCTHEERPAIDHALAAGRSYRDIAGRFSVSRSALDRHNADHLSPAVQKAQQTADAAHALDIVQQLREINAVSLDIMREAKASGNAVLALKAVERLQKQVELQARLLGELADGPTVNVLLAPEWHTVRTVLLAALAPFPEARAAVAQQLVHLDGADGLSD